MQAPQSSPPSQQVLESAELEVLRLDMQHIHVVLPFWAKGYKRSLENIHRQMRKVFFVIKKLRQGYPELEEKFTALKDWLLGMSGGLALLVVGRETKEQKMTNLQWLRAYIRVVTSVPSGHLTDEFKIFCQNLYNLELIARSITRVHVFNKMIVEMQQDSSLDQAAIAEITARYQQLYTQDFMLDPLHGFYGENFTDRINIYVRKLRELLHDLQHLARNQQSFDLVDPAAANPIRHQLTWTADLILAPADLATEEVASQERPLSPAIRSRKSATLTVAT